MNSPLDTIRDRRDQNGSVHLEPPQKTHTKSPALSRSGTFATYSEQIVYNIQWVHHWMSCADKMSRLLAIDCNPTYVAVEADDDGHDEDAAKDASEDAAGDAAEDDEDAAKNESESEDGIQVL